MKQAPTIKVELTMAQARTLLNLIDYAGGTEGIDLVNVLNARKKLNEAFNVE